MAKASYTLVTGGSSVQPITCALQTHQISPKPNTNATYNDECVIIQIVQDFSMLLCFILRSCFIADFIYYHTVTTYLLNRFNNVKIFITGIFWTAAIVVKI